MALKKMSSIVSKTEKQLKSGILDETSRKVALECVHIVQKMLDIDTNGCSVFPWRDCGIHRFHPNPERDNWRTWTKKEIEEGIPEDAIIGDCEKTYVGAIRGYDSNTDIPSMSKNRNLIIQSVNLVASIRQRLYDAVN